MQSQRDLWLDPEYDAFEAGHEPSQSVFVWHRILFNVFILVSIGAIAMLVQSL
jgi:hypothetical protein